jgi:SagB-type dehydrogenase family enzyme
MTKPVPDGDALAGHFWQRALFDVERLIAEEGRGREDSVERPPPVPARQGRTRYPLPRPADWLGPPGVGRAVPAPLTPATLSTLLHHTYGLVRLEVGRAARWPFHRTVASARCFFPTELYCAVPAMAGLPAGVYAYDAGHHSLVAVRYGTDPDAAGPTLFLSTVYWRTAFMYRSYAYRLVTQEAGLVLGNALAVADALGWPAQVRHRFDQAAGEALLDLRPPDESLLGVIALHPPLRPAGPVAAPPAVPARRAVDRPPPVDDDLCADLLELDAAARAEPPGEAAPTPTNGNREPADRGTPGARPGPDLAELLRRRWSGDAMFIPRRRPVPLETVARIVGHALDPFPSDAGPGGIGPAATCFVWTPSVSDAAAAVYQVVAGTLRPLPDGQRTADRLRDAVEQAGMAPNIKYRTANLVAFVVADLAGAGTTLGARSVRVLSQETGVVAHRICLAAAAESLAARIHNGYPSRLVVESLRLPAGHAPLFQIVVGSVPPGRQYLRVIDGGR